MGILERNGLCLELHGKRKEGIVSFLWNCLRPLLALVYICLWIGVHSNKFEMTERNER